ncbi:MAG: transcription antitermination factor NusB [Gammaproteobacteria bacterium]|uniref:transcription antitermination factor NusB n=1 Tax=Limnobacter sp. TaxID=2003368 RepID=UPI001D4F032D|nr:transcription antitermination factor NusB [Limnobacter sp.]MBU0784029.1 transcription antitermination factor NusB [Gammaproteobacteria bacterium]MBU0848925.1 transcription antitermination factor NusB [Gammaproteobacteria bacterium]MBU1268263.1 transcription antitermination factor NusB [Gammaproteobacteria bacterium]MBU1527820.1 transcription antitermination factor NusB [Gammaproteobacteria bacterium]MBU1778862.1 transcription antitermination factor NusB [Gammaproteobacteria bacterium]
MSEVRKPDSGKRQGHTRNARRRSRELALQGLYQWFLNPSDVGEIDAHIRDAPGFDKADRDHYESLLHGSVHHLEDLMHQIQPFIDRPWGELSPVEKAVLVLASHEMNTHSEIPYRVVINEAVELTKTFGGTDAFKFVNGVLDKVAAQARDTEIKAQSNVQSS